MADSKYIQRSAPAPRPSLSEQQFRDAMAFSAIGTALVSLEGVWMHTNAAVCSLLGYDDAELRQINFQKLTHPDDLSADLELVDQLLAGEIAAYQMEKRYIRKDGSLVWTLLSVSLVRNGAGKPQYFISHIQDIGERKQAEAERERLMREAQAANAAKSEFLANMSHEIRTPLNGVLGMAQAMAADTLSPQQQARLGVIRESGGALLEILNDILDLSKIEAGMLELEAAPFDLDDLVVSTLRSFEATAQHKGLSLDLEVREPCGIYLGDQTRVRQVLTNLVSNAIKFTAHGRITIHATRLDNGFELAVADTGVGIASTQVERIFSKFMQADTSTTRKHGGTGLGLSICSDLVALMGGRIEVTSTPDVGSTFRAAFPLARVGDAAPRAEEAQAPKLATPGVRLLAAEDNPTNQLVIRTLLGQLGIDVVLVPNGREAVQAWRDGDWTAVLMDVQMPIMDGVAATRAIRELEEVQGSGRTPIIGLTANAMPHQTQRYLDAGMDACVAKPIDLQALLAALAQVLNAPDEAIPALREQSA